MARTNAAAAAIVKRYHKRPATELFNLRADPFELNNLAAAPARTARVKELRGQLETWMKEQGNQQAVYSQPRLLSDPASTGPGRNSASDSAAPAEN